MSEKRSAARERRLREALLLGVDNASLKLNRGAWLAHEKEPCKCLPKLLSCVGGREVAIVRNGWINTGANQLTLAIWLCLDSEEESRLF